MAEWLAGWLVVWHIQAARSHSIHSQLALFILNDIDVNKSANEIDPNVISRHRRAIQIAWIGLYVDELNVHCRAKLVYHMF